MAESQPLEPDSSKSLAEVANRLAVLRQAQATLAEQIWDMQLNPSDLPFVQSQMAGATEEASERPGDLLAQARLLYWLEKFHELSNKLEE